MTMLWVILLPYQHLDYIESNGRITDVLERILKEMAMVW